MKVNNGTFSGGYKFRNFEGNPNNKVIELEIPPTVTIPLRQGFGGEVTAVVKPGEKVKAGQVIGVDNKSISSPIHSSINGIVEKITTIKHFNREVNAVVIKSDGTKDWQSLDGYSKDWSKLSSKQIQELLYKSGVTSLDNSGIPTEYKSSVISPKEVEHVIINGISTETFNLSISALLDNERKFELEEGLKILKAIMPKAKFHIAIDKDNNRLIEDFTKLLADFDWIELYSLPTKYPQNFDEVLVPTILGKKYPYGYSAANIGVVVLSIQTVLHAHDAVVLGKPLIDRTVALGGPGWNENIHIKVRVGTPIEYIMNGRIKEDFESRIIVNSLLTNESLSSNSLPVDRTFSVLIALKENKKRELFSFVRGGRNRDSYSNTFISSICPRSRKTSDTNIHGEHRPCISCGYCEEVCPVNIIPHLISKHVKNNMLDESVVDYGIFNCIECNLCSYVCPSKINVAKSIKEGQQKLNNDGYSHDTVVLPSFDLKGLKEYKGIK